MRIVQLLVLFATFSLFSQEKVEGIVLEVYDGKEVPLSGANVFWLDSEIGAVTDFKGLFKIPYNAKYDKLIISFVGYKTDTITINKPRKLRHVLTSTDALDEVTVSSRRKTSSRSYLQSQNVINVSSSELLKAACCNLSESFETNPSIDVNIADAVTGSKQIRLLGLTTPYTLFTVENIPSIRGASQAYGLSFIPGTWVESIQITKGAGSVVNGFESIAGQINTELVKPTTDDQVYVNIYEAVGGRLEFNAHLNTTVSEKWDAGLYIHRNFRGKRNDRNDDGFLDNPLMGQINVMNRWQYTDQEKGFVSFINLHYLNDHKQIGQTTFLPERDTGSTSIWGGEIDTERYAATVKLGYVFPELPYQSIGIQAAYSHHNQESFFGIRDYNIKHKSGYVNALFNSIISDSRHTFKTGINATYDNYDELVETTTFTRTERSLGAFFEYSYDDLENLTLTAGLRADTHNLLGNFITPRIHARYTPWDKAALRVSAGRGKRSANIFAENQSLFATSRAIFINNQGGEIFGLDPEIAWNYGISLLQGFNLFDRKGDVTFDFYRTDFVNQVVVDWEDVNQVRFYNLENGSTANSFQVEVNYNILEHFDFRTAYKYYDVEIEYASGKEEKPLTPNHRVFANLGYESFVKNNSQWKFDLTYNWLGSQRFANTQGNAPQFRLPERSPSFGTFTAQITRVFSPRFEGYAGAENFTDVTQDNPILDPENPFGSNFDTTFVYGPIFGSNYYAGLRYRIPSKNNE